MKKNWRQINNEPLREAGAFVRTVMRRGIRRGKNPSRVGSPPHAHRPKDFRGRADFKRIFFDYTITRTGMVIGHEGLGQKQTPMETQEFGQRVTVFQRRKRQPARSRKQAAAARRLFKSGKLKQEKSKKITITMPKRPFAKPALEKSVAKLPSFWRDSISHSSVRNVNV